MLYWDQDSALDVYSVRMTAKHARLARRIGDGNLSKGIRECIEIVSKEMINVLQNQENKRNENNQ